jgi:hypothetical protein
LLDSWDGGSEFAVAPPPAAVPVGIDATLRWRDYILIYDGQVRWDGRSPTAQIAARITDGGFNRVIVPQANVLAGVVSGGSGLVAMNAQFAVPGDSRTAGAHTHGVQLRFQLQPDGQWRFVQACDPYGCY